MSSTRSTRSNKATVKRIRTTNSKHESEPNENEQNNLNDDVANIIPSSISSTSTSSSTTAVNKQKRRKTASELRAELAKAEQQERLQAVNEASSLSEFFDALIELTDSHIHEDQDINANQCTRNTDSTFTMFALPSGDHHDDDDDDDDDDDSVKTVKLKSTVTHINTEGESDVSASFKAEKIGRLVSFDNENETNCEEHGNFDYGVDNNIMQQLLLRLHWSPRVNMLLQPHHNKSKSKNKNSKKKEGGKDEGDNDTILHALLRCLRQKIEQRHGKEDDFGVTWGIDEDRIVQIAE